MGENGAFAREMSHPAAAVFDPVALEERLKVARQLRAEAIARRQVAAAAHPQQSNPQQTSQPIPPPGPALRAFAPDDARPAPQVPAAPPAPVPGRRAPSAPRVDGPRAPRLAHPLIALLALGLSVSFALSRGGPPPPAPAPPAAEARPTVQAVQAARAPQLPAPRPAPEPSRPTAATPPVSVASIPAVAVAAPEPAPVARAADTPEPPATPAPPPAGPEPAVAAASTVQPAPAAAPPPSDRPAAAPPAAPRAERILVNAPRNVRGDAIDAALAALRATGFADVNEQPTRLTISASTVRFYNAEDAAAAAEIAAIVGPFLPGGVAEARDFTDAPSRGAPGHLEVWVAGSSPGPGPGRGARQSAVAPVEIQRLVASVFAQPAVEHVGRGLTDAARGFETGAERVAREIDAAVAGAVRALEGRP